MGETNRYVLPDDGIFRTINFSGGRSSGYMLYRILQAHGGEIPEHAKVVFCNTGKEREETLEFVRQCEQSWGVEIAWLEFEYIPEPKEGEHKYSHREVTFETAARNGEPFADLLEHLYMIPTPMTRTCTKELKVATVERYLRRTVGVLPAKARNVIGIRYDEPTRWRKMLKEGCSTDYPLVLAKVARAEVDAFWQRNNFDLAISSVYSNCDLCFLKGKKAIVASIRAEPWRADWWIAQEDRAKEWPRAKRLDKPHIAYFMDNHTYRDLKLIATSNQEFDFGDDTPIADCFCGD